MSKRVVSLSGIALVIILAASVVVVATLTLTQFGTFGIVQGLPILTAQQKAAICDPNNPSLKVVNTTESRICGIPKTVKPSINATSANTTASSSNTSSSSSSSSLPLSSEPTPQFPP